MAIDFMIQITYWGIFLAEQNNTIISAFYPQYAMNRYHVSNGVIGVIFCAQNVGVFFSKQHHSNATYYIGKVMNNEGYKKQIIIAGIIIQMIANVLFLSSQYTDDTIQFISICLISRVLSGIGVGFFRTPIYSYLPILYPDQLEEKIAYSESFSWLGASLGPLFGGLLFTYCGYNASFYFTLFISIPLLIISIICIPSENIKKKHTKDQLEQIKAQQRLDILDDGVFTSIEYELDYTELLSKKNILYPYLVIFCASMMLGFLDPCLGPYLHHQYNLTEDLVGVVFFFGALIYIICCPLGALLAKKFTQYRVLLFTGLFMSTLGIFFMAPSLDLPKQLYYVFFGQALMNFGNIFIYIPVIPEIVKSLHDIYDDIPDEIISDISSSLFNNAYSLGYILGPLFGGISVQYLGFSNVCLYIGLMLIVFSIIYVFTGDIFYKKLQISTLTNENIKTLANKEKNVLKFFRAFSIHKSQQVMIANRKMLQKKKFSDQILDSADNLSQKSDVALEEDRFQRKRSAQKKRFNTSFASIQ